MIVIRAVGTHVPEHTEVNLDRAEQFDLDEKFVDQKLGVREVSRMGEDEDTADLCMAALGDLEQVLGAEVRDADCLVVCTQNPDGHGIPHTSAVVHGRSDQPDACAAFDISLGCSGYVYGLSVVRAFMEANGLRRGLFFTADPYSKIVDRDDRSTVLLFGDAATVTLLTDDADRGWALDRFAFATRGADGDALHNHDGPLVMNGRAVFDFSATRVPAQITQLLRDVGLSADDVDLYLLHQGSKYIVDTITRRLRLDPERVPLKLAGHGNTVSSSIPLMLADHVHRQDIDRIVMSGFGVGLSYATGLLQRRS